ncbi:MAG: WYL domain-containing protein [Nitrospiria bacterium]
MLKGGKIRLDLKLAVTPALMQWIFSFGAQVEVLKPVRLKRMVENEAWRLLGRYQKVKLGRTRITKK